MNLKYNADAIAAFVAKAADADAIAVLARQVAAGDIEDDALDRLIDALVKRVKVGKMIIKRAVTNARKGQARQRHQADQDRRAAERTDPGLASRHPWLTRLAARDGGAERRPRRIHRRRTTDARPSTAPTCVVHVRRVHSMHALTAEGANQEESKESRLPAPEQPLLPGSQKAEVAEVIERHIDYFDPKDGRSVHLAAPFVKHFSIDPTTALPWVAAIATLPMVLPDGTPLHGRGLDRSAASCSASHLNS